SREEGRRRRGRRAACRTGGAKAHRRAHEDDRRAAEAQRSRNHGSVSAHHDTAAAPIDAPEDVARSVAIILDGNARWARQRGLPIAEGHRAGTKALRRTVEAAIDLGIESLTVYAFSTENWNRPPDEVELLMEILTETIERELPDLVTPVIHTRIMCADGRTEAHSELWLLRR